MIPVSGWETNLALLIVWLMRPTQWLSGKRKGDALDFSLMLSQLVTKLPLIYLQPQQREKLAGLDFCKWRKLITNKFLAALIRKKKKRYRIFTKVKTYMCRVTGITNFFFIFQKGNAGENNIRIMLRVQNSDTEQQVVFLGLVYTLHETGAS